MCGLLWRDFPRTSLRVGTWRGGEGRGGRRGALDLKSNNPHRGWVEDRNAQAGNCTGMLPQYAGWNNSGLQIFPGRLRPLFALGRPLCLTMHAFTSSSGGVSVCIEIFLHPTSGLLEKKHNAPHIATCDATHSGQHLIEDHNIECLGQTAGQLGRNVASI